MLTRLEIKDRIIFKQTDQVTKEETLNFLEIIADIKNLKSQLAEKKALLISMLSRLTLEEKAQLKAQIDEAKL
jgi:hypothetical protein